MRYAEFYKNAEIQYEKKKKLLKKFGITGFVIGSIAAVFLTLFFTSGIVTDNGKEEIIYGESMNTPSSFLATSVREYEINGIWTDTAPSTPGTYPSRIVSKSIFGRKTIKYTDDFIVNKRKVSIYSNVKNVIYGGVPSVSADLYGMDVLSSYSLIYDSMVMADTEVEVDKESVVIKNKDGLDVTSCYEIETPKTPISFTQVPIVITLKDKEKTYDGEALTSKDYDMNGALYYGDTLEIETEGSQTYAGSSVNTIKDIKIISKDNEEINHYRIKCVDGTLTVNPLEVSITTSDTEVSFNGEIQYFTDYTSDITIPDEAEGVSEGFYQAGTYTNKVTLDFTNEEIKNSYKLSYTYGTVTIKPSDLTVTLADVEEEYSDTSAYENVSYDVISGSLYDAVLTVNAEASMTSWKEGTLSESSYRILKDDTDLTSSYNITFNSSVITKTPRKITVSPAVSSKEYDGLSFETDIFEIKEGSLINGDTLSITSLSSEVFPGTYTIGINEYSIRNSDTDVKERYSVTLSSSTLEITKKKITVVPKNISVSYGDIPCYEAELKDCTLAEGDILKELEQSSYTSLLKIGENEVTLNDKDIRIVHNEEDYTSYYEITAESGTLTVTTRKITVSIMSKSKVYDGTSLEYEDGDMYLKEGTLAYSDEITFSVPSVSITYAGRTPSALSTDNVQIKDGDIDKLECYDVVFENGFLTITKRNLTFTSGSISKEYNFTVLTLDEYEVSGLMGTDHVDNDKTSITGSLNHVGTVSNTVEAVYISNAEGKDVSSSYNITIYEGTLTFTERGDD